MIASSWRKAVTLVLLASASLFVPGAAHAAAPTITDVKVYGNTTPTHPDAASATKGAGVVFANSAPYGPFTYDDGLVFFRGTATPGVEILITVREEPDDPTTPNITHRVTTQTLSQGNPGFFSGEIGNCSGPTCIKIQELGTHAASTTDSSDPDPTKWGPTVLRLGFIARNSLNEVSAETVRTITKYAGTPLDNTAPEFRGLKMPSSMWCHNSRLISGDFQLLGSPQLQASGTFHCNPADHETHEVALVTAPPPLTVCTLFRVTLANVRLTSCAVSTMGSRGDACVCGSVIDNPKSAYNVASEIANVTVTITDGALTAPRVYQPLLERGGSQAGFGVKLKVNDFEPTWPKELTGFDPYKITVVATDAWGKSVTTTSTFHVTPF